MTRRYALRDDQWERIRDLLPGRVGHVGGTALEPLGPKQGVGNGI